MPKSTVVRSASESTSGATGPAAAESGRVRRRVLVVDDNRDAARCIAILLKWDGHEVRTAADGQEAVELTPDFHPDVILMDLAMPRMNGLEATRLIRKQSGGDRIVIIALTAWDEPTAWEQSRDAGCDGHVVKPVSDLELLKLVENL